MEKKKLENYVRKAVIKNLPEDLIMQKMVKAGFSEIDIHQAIKKAEYEKSNIKEKKVGLVHFIPLLIPLIIVGYVVYMNYMPYTKTYTVDVGSQNDVNSLSKAYLKDENKTSVSSITGHTTYKVVKKSPIYFIIEPDVILDNRTIVNVELVFQSDSDLYISLTDGKNFSWVPIYLKALDDYNLAAEFYDANVYSLDKKKFISSSSVIDFLVNNVPEKAKLSIINYNVNPTLIKKYGYKISTKLTNESSFIIISNYKHPDIKKEWLKSSVSLPYNDSLGSNIRIALKATKKDNNVKIDALKVQILQ